MEPWNAIQYVTTGLALLAFVIAAALTAYRIKLKSRERVLLDLGPKNAQAIAIADEYIPFEARDLPEDQRFAIALEQIRARDRRDRRRVIAAVIVCCLFAGVAVAAFAYQSPERPSSASGTLGNFRRDMNTVTGGVVVNLGGDLASFWFDTVSGKADRDLPHLICERNPCLSCTQAADGRSVTIALKGATRPHPERPGMLTCAS